MIYLPAKLAERLVEPFQTVPVCNDRGQYQTLQQQDSAGMLAMPSTNQETAKNHQVCHVQELKYNIHIYI